MKKIFTLSLIVGCLSGCSTWDKLDKTEKGALIGGGSGALIGGAATRGTGGALIGGAAGAIGGGVIGHQME
jgi:uncharacterized protein YceK